VSGTVVATGAERAAAAATRTETAGTVGMTNVPTVEPAGPDRRSRTEQAQDALRELAAAGRLGPAELLELAEHWCASLTSAHTARAYREAVRGWLLWCDAVRRIDSLRAGFVDAEAYDTHLKTDPSPRTARPISEATRRARLAALSSWYRRLTRLDLVTQNPFTPDAISWPGTDADYSPTVGLSGPEAAALLKAARADTGPQAKRTAALIGVLLTCGPRVAEVIAADTADLSYDAGHRILTVTGKGGKKRAAVIAPGIGRDLDAYLDGRTDGPLFATAAGRRLDQAAVWRLIRRIARAAGVTAWDRISPHSARHTAITLALDNGAALHDVQDMAGHADPRTTRRYDRRRGHLDRSPTYRIAAALGGDA
jgi:integrase/recombinase XerD